MAVNNFDLVAPFYDRLAKLVFGDHLLKAQLLFLDQIRPADTVLILGGGTGEILKYISDCKSIDYVEKSEKMIERASKEGHKQNVSFIHVDFFDIKVKTKYDVIICPFFLDCFNEKYLLLAADKIQMLLKREGRLMVSDFQTSGSNSMQLKMMHIFFRFFAKLEARSLLNIHQILLEKGFVSIDEKILHRNRIFSRLYRNL